MDGVFLHVWLFFIPVVAFGAFLIVQLFLAVLSDTFNLESGRDAALVAKAKADAAAAVDAGDEGEAEVEDVDGDGVVELDMSNKPAAQRLCYAIISNHKFQFCMLGAIICNTALMCCDYYGQPDTYARTPHAASRAQIIRAARPSEGQEAGGMEEAGVLVRSARSPPFPVCCAVVRPPHHRRFVPAPSLRSLSVSPLARLALWLAVWLPGCA